MFVSDDFSNWPELLWPLLPLLPLSLRLVSLTLRRFLRLFFLSSDIELLEWSRNGQSGLIVRLVTQWPVWPLTDVGPGRVLHHLPMMTLAKLSSGAGLGSGIISPGRFSRQGQVFITRLAENITTLDMITRHQMTRGQGLMTRKHGTCHAGIVRYYHFFCLRKLADCSNQTMDDG